MRSLLAESVSKIDNHNHSLLTYFLYNQRAFADLLYALLINSSLLTMTLSYFPLHTTPIESLTVISRKIFSPSIFATLRAKVRGSPSKVAFSWDNSIFFPTVM